MGALLAFLIATMPVAQVAEGSFDNPVYGGGGGGSSSSTTATEVGTCEDGAVLYNINGIQSCGLGADTAAADKELQPGQDAWEFATTNTTGGDSVLSGGLGTHRLNDVTDASCDSGVDTITYTVDGTPYVRTAGTSWTVGVSDADTCANIAADAAANVPGLEDSTCVGTDVGLTGSAHTLDVQSSDNACAQEVNGTDGSVVVRSKQLVAPSGNSSGNIGLLMGPGSTAGISQTADALHFYASGSLRATLGSSWALGNNIDLTQSGSSAYLGNLTTALCLDNGNCAASTHALGAGDVLAGQSLEVDGDIYADGDIVLPTGQRVYLDGAASANYVYSDGTSIYMQSPTTFLRVGANAIFTNSNVSTTLQGNSDNIQLTQYTATATTPGDTVATLTHRGYNGSATRELFQLITYADDSTPASEESHTTFSVYENGVQTEYLRLDGSDSSQAILASRPVQFGSGAYIIGANGETIDNATDGKWTFTGTGGANNEVLVIDLETTSNTAAFSSPTGISLYTFDQTLFASGNVISTGYVRAGPAANIWWNTRSEMQSKEDGQWSVENAANTAGATLDIDDYPDTFVVKDQAGTGDGNLVTTGYTQFGTGAQLLEGTTTSSVILQQSDSPTNNVCLNTNGDTLRVYTGTCSTFTQVLMGNGYFSNATGGLIELWRADGTPNNDDVVGTLQMNSYDSGLASQNYATVSANIEEVTAGDEDGSLVFSVFDNGSLTEYLRLDATDGVESIVASKPIALLQGDAIVFDRDFESNDFIHASANNIITLRTNGTITYQTSATQLWVRQDLQIEDSKAIRGEAAKINIGGTAASTHALGDDDLHINTNTEVDGFLYTDDQVLAQDGTAALPSYSFSSDPNTGMFSVAADNLRFVAGGTYKMGVNTAGPYMGANVNMQAFALQGATQIVTNYTEASSPVALNQFSSGSNFTNTGATAEVEFQPAGANPVGTWFDFSVIDTDGIQVTAAAGETIQIGALGGAGACIASTEIGATAHCVAVTATQIFCTIEGTWTVDVGC